MPPCPHHPPSSSNYYSHSPFHPPQTSEKRSRIFSPHNQSQSLSFKYQPPGLPQQNHHPFQRQPHRPPLSANLHYSDSYLQQYTQSTTPSNPYYAAPPHRTDSAPARQPPVLLPSAPIPVQQAPAAENLYPPSNIRHNYNVFPVAFRFTQQPKKRLSSSSPGARDMDAEMRGEMREWRREEKEERKVRIRQQEETVEKLARDCGHYDMKEQEEGLEKGPKCSGKCWGEKTRLVEGVVMRNGGANGGINGMNRMNGGISGGINRGMNGHGGSKGGFEGGGTANRMNVGFEGGGATNMMNGVYGDTSTTNMMNERSDGVEEGHNSIRQAKRELVPLDRKFHEHKDLQSPPQKQQNYQQYDSYDDYMCHDYNVFAPAANNYNGSFDNVYRGNGGYAPPQVRESSEILGDAGAEDVSKALVKVSLEEYYESSRRTSPICVEEVRSFPPGLRGHRNLPQRSRQSPSASVYALPSLPPQAPSSSSAQAPPPPLLPHHSSPSPSPSPSPQPPSRSFSASAPSFTPPSPPHPLRQLPSSPPRVPLFVSSLCPPFISPEEYPQEENLPQDYPREPFPSTDLSPNDYPPSSFQPFAPLHDKLSHTPLPRQGCYNIVPSHCFIPFPFPDSLANPPVPGGWKSVREMQVKSWLENRDLWEGDERGKVEKLKLPIGQRGDGDVGRQEEGKGERIKCEWKRRYKQWMWEELRKQAEERVIGIISPLGEERWVEMCGFLGWKEEGEVEEREAVWEWAVEGGVYGGSFC